MKRLGTVLSVMLASLIMLVPVTLAADDEPTSEHVLLSFQGDITLPDGETAGFVLVTDGTATIRGDVDVVVAINGRVELDGATVDELIAIGSPVQVGTGSTVTGDVVTLDTASVTVAADATLNGSVRDLTPGLIGLGAVLVPAMFLLFVGFVLLTLVAGLALAAIAARQVRAAETLISTEPGPVLVTGLAGTILPLLLVAILFLTVVGAPLGMAILIGVWPAAAYLGYLVAGIWIGDWVLHRTSPGVERERPYLASVVGLLILQALTIVPFVTPIASLFGFGAVLLLAWRVFRSGSVGTTPVHRGSPAPMPG